MSLVAVTNGAVGKQNYLQPVSHDRSFVATVHRDEDAPGRRKRLRAQRGKSSTPHFATSTNKEAYDIWQYEPCFTIQENHLGGVVFQHRGFQNETQVSSNLAGLPVNVTVRFIGLADVTNTRNSRNGKSINNNDGWFACAMEGHRSTWNISDETFFPGDWAVVDLPKGAFDVKSGNIVKPRCLPPAYPEDKFLLTIRPFRLDRMSQFNLGAAALEMDMMTQEEVDVSNPDQKFKRHEMIAHLFRLQYEKKYDKAKDAAMKYLPGMEGDIEAAFEQAGGDDADQAQVVEKLKLFIGSRHYEFWLQNICGKVTNHSPPETQLNLGLKPGY